MLVAIIYEALWCKRDCRRPACAVGSAPVQVVNLYLGPTLRTWSDGDSGLLCLRGLATTLDPGWLRAGNPSHARPVTVDLAVTRLSQGSHPPSSVCQAFLRMLVLAGYDVPLVKNENKRNVGSKVGVMRVRCVQVAKAPCSSLRACKRSSPYHQAARPVATTATPPNSVFQWPSMNSSVSLLKKSSDIMRPPRRVILVLEVACYSWSCAVGWLSDALELSEGRR